MRLSIALPLALAAAVSASHDVKLRANVDSSKSPEMRALIASKTEKARKLSDLLKSLKEKTNRDLQGQDGIAAGGGFDFDLGDLEIGSFGLCGDDNDLEFMGARCWCTLSSGENEYNDLMDLIGDFSYIMDNGMEIEFGCEMPTVCDTSIGVNECSAGQVTCTMDINTQDFISSSFDCDTCVRYDCPPSENGEPDCDAKPTLMTGHKLCMDVDMCPPDVKTKRSGLLDNFEFDMSNILCGCTATLDDEDCTCELCDDFMGGVELTCGEGRNQIASSCQETGLEFVDASDVSTLTQVKFAPQFAIVQSDMAETSAGVTSGVLYSVFVAALSIGAFLISSLA